MVDIQSATDEIRRGMKKKKKERNQRTGFGTAKIIEIG